MPAPHWENLKGIFNAAVALPPADRAAYLDRACDGNDSLRQAVDSLIKSHEERANLLMNPHIRQQLVPERLEEIVEKALTKRIERSAFEWLEKAYAEHSDGLLRLKEELGFDNLRSDPRYADLLQRVGLPQ